MSSDTSMERWSVALRQLALHHIADHPDCPRLEEIIAVINEALDPETEAQEERQ